MAFKLETPRLILRELNTEDASNFYHLNLNPEVIKYTGDPPFESITEARVFLEHYKEYQKHGYGRWAVLEKHTGNFIGWCGLKFHDEGYTDLGFRFFQDKWGNGFATESAKACIKHAKDELHIPELIGRVLPENKGSIRVLEKLGFVYFKRGTCNGIDGSLYYKLDLKTE